ncbi:hypothetical protein BD626DRAFT_211592 [Schizophyllum amplum]|uniref:Uncharacterized protein n=1 Tax=Schizophyllum amplum TaxID=97359 RepID=A0A550BY35_9AGAR|nr:hypothetical protein BD626DRAFT_211592 [Auriculariopsis ampla]
MDNTNRPFQLRINKNSRPFAAFSHQHDTGTNAHSSTTQTTQRRWMDSTGANAGPAKLFASSGRTEQRSSLRFKISSSAPPSDHSVDDDIAPAPRHLGDGTQASGPTYGNEDSHSATPPPSVFRPSSTHARVDSRNSHLGPPPRGLRSQTDFDYDDMPDTSHSDANQGQSGKGGKMLWQVCQHNEALEEKLAALREELEGSKLAASASSRLLHEREQDLEEKIAALAELERTSQAQEAERAAQVVDLQDQLKNALPRLSALEAENKDLTQRLLDSEERVTQAERRAQDAERRCEQALRDTEARVALVTQQAADIKTEAHVAVEEARQDALNIREEAKKRMHDLKTSMKKKVEGLSEKFTDLSCSFATVQAQRLTWDSRASELELGVGELQAAVKSSLTAMQPFLTSDAGVLKISETRELVEELQADRTSAHQVTDMLRDKLHIVSTQLVEAKDRIAELENILAEDKRRVRSSTDDLCSLGTKMEHLTDRLAKREQESREAFDDAVATGQALGEANGK